PRPALRPTPRGDAGKVEMVRGKGADGEYPYIERPGGGGATEHSTTLFEPRSPLPPDVDLREETRQTIHTPGTAGVESAYTDFVTRLTHPDPRQRLTAEQALEHPFLAHRLLDDTAASAVVRREAAPAAPGDFSAQVRACREKRDGFQTLVDRLMARLARLNPEDLADIKAWQKLWAALGAGEALKALRGAVEAYRRSLPDLRRAAASGITQLDGHDLALVIRDLNADLKAMNAIGRDLAVALRPLMARKARLAAAAPAANPRT
ncbi:MAG: hypothetical protein LC745_02665, partial [Planctomycetia bacterium]|nr:hypothetical protein [Planctomycetia bacterium]